MPMVLTEIGLGDFPEETEQHPERVKHGHVWTMMPCVSVLILSCRWVWLYLTLALISSTLSSGLMNMMGQSPP